MRELNNAELRWNTLWSSCLRILNIEDLIETDLVLRGYVFELINLYVSENRNYHNEIHIDYMLSKLEAFKNTVSEKEYNLLELAILFHDVVYIPGSAYNEKASAAYAAVIMKRCLFSEEDIDSVVELIHATIYTNNPYVGDNVNIQIMRDLDMLAMAEDYKDFYLTQLSIVSEFNIIITLDSDLIAWHKNVLSKSMSGEEPIFLLPIHKNLESKVQDNLKRYIAGEVPF